MQIGLIDNKLSTIGKGYDLRKQVEIVIGNDFGIVCVFDWICEEAATINSHRKKYGLQYPHTRAQKKDMEHQERVKSLLFTFGINLRLSNGMTLFSYATEWSNNDETLLTLLQNEFGVQEPFARTLPRITSTQQFAEKAVSRITMIWKDQRQVRFHPKFDNLVPMISTESTEEEVFHWGNYSKKTELTLLANSMHILKMFESGNISEARQNLKVNTAEQLEKKRIELLQVESVRGAKLEIQETKEAEIKRDQNDLNLTSANQDGANNEPSMFLKRQPRINDEPSRLSEDPGSFKITKPKVSNLIEIMLKETRTRSLVDDTPTHSSLRQASNASKHRNITDSRNWIDVVHLTFVELLSLFDFITDILVFLLFVKLRNPIWAGIMILSIISPYLVAYTAFGSLIQYSQLHSNESQDHERTNVEEGLLRLDKIYDHRNNFRQAIRTIFAIGLLTPFSILYFVLIDIVFMILQVCEFLVNMITCGRFGNPIKDLSSTILYQILGLTHMQ
ncbi:hypothetical protein RFI_12963, partial [Reticulomyxa filosa]